MRKYFRIVNHMHGSCTQCTNHAWQITPRKRTQKKNWLTKNGKRRSLKMFFCCSVVHLLRFCGLTGARFASATHPHMGPDGEERALRICVFLLFSVVFLCLSATFLMQFGCFLLFSVLFVVFGLLVAVFCWFLLLSSVSLSLQKVQEGP